MCNFRHVLSIFWLVKMGVSARKLPVFCQRVKAWIYGLLINEDSLLYGYLEDTYYVSENVRRQSPSSTPPHPTPVQTLMPSSMHCLTMRFLFYFLFISFFFLPIDFEIEELQSFLSPSCFHI